MPVYQRYTTGSIKEESRQHTRTQCLVVRVCGEASRMAMCHCIFVDPRVDGGLVGQRGGGDGQGRVAEGDWWGHTAHNTHIHEKKPRDLSTLGLARLPLPPSLALGARPHAGSTASTRARDSAARARWASPLNKKPHKREKSHSLRRTRSVQFLFYTPSTTPVTTAQL